MTEVDAPAGWETELFGQALASAPSVLNTQPWTLRVRPDRVELSERTDVVLPFHDPTGRDRTISCGAAAVNLELALRAVGRSVRRTLSPEPEEPTLRVRFDLVGRADPTATERALHAAVPRRGSHRAPFAARPVPEATVADLVAAAGAEDVWIHPVAGDAELEALADQLSAAGRAYRGDEGYQRELALWTVRDENHRRHGAGVARSSMLATGRSVPSAGIVRPRTEVPDRADLVENLRRERMLLSGTDTDDASAHLRAGAALQRVWLTAVAAGLAGAVQTQPLQLPRIRTELARRFGFDGYLQTLFRVGHPVGRPPASPRRSLGDVLHREP